MKEDNWRSYVDKDVLHYEVFVKNPKVIELRLVGEQPPPPEDLFTAQLQGLLAHNGRETSVQAVYLCMACECEVTSILQLRSHCKNKHHVNNENALLSRKQAHRENYLLGRESLCLGSQQTSIGAVVKENPHFCYIGLQYIVEYTPNEFDSLPLYVCGLTTCEFLGYANELKDHISSLDHCVGFLLLHCIDKGRVDMGEIKEYCYILYAHDIESYDKDPTLMVARVNDTCEHSRVKRGLITHSFRDFVQTKVLADWETLKALTKEAEATFDHFPTSDSVDDLPRTSTDFSLSSFPDTPSNYFESTPIEDDVLPTQEEVSEVIVPQTSSMVTDKYTTVCTDMASSSARDKVSSSVPDESSTNEAPNVLPSTLSGSVTRKIDNFQRSLADYVHDCIDNWLAKEGMLTCNELHRAEIYRIEKLLSRKYCEDETIAFQATCEDISLMELTPTIKYRIKFRSTMYLNWHKSDFWLDVD